MKIKNIEDFIYRMKEAELNLTIWAWHSEYESEQRQLKTLSAQLGEATDRMVYMGMGRFGYNEEWLSLQSIEVISKEVNTEYLRDLLDDLDVFYDEKVKDIPELAALLAGVMGDISKVLYYLNLN